MNPKVDVPGYPRHEGPNSGHLTECLVVQEYEAAQWLNLAWPPDYSWPHCTCDEETP